MLSMMRQLRTEDAQTFAAFIMPGEGHCVIHSSQFYTQSAGVGQEQMTASEWVGELLTRNPGMRWGDENGVGDAEIAPE